jgi:hypothetical protein
MIIDGSRNFSPLASFIAADNYISGLPVKQSSPRGVSESPAIFDERNSLYQADAVQQLPARPAVIPY